MALPIEAIRGVADMVQPSQELLQVVEAIKLHVDSLIRVNPDLEISLYSFPTKLDFEENLAKRSAVLSKLWVSL
jgi:adenine C2-methylase RlmN of 23S rRNA A2503 and tRNA A37